MVSHLRWIRTLKRQPPPAPAQHNPTNVESFLLSMMLNTPEITLPYEVLNEVTLYLPLSTKVTLMGVSRAFRSICTRDVYKHLSVKKLSTLLHLCQILSRNESALDAVRSLCLDIAVEFRGRSPVKLSSELSTADTQLLQSTLLKLSENLVELVVLSLPADLEFCIPSNFPNLESYVSAISVTEKTISFIQQNSHIRELRLFGFPTSNLPRTTVHLPNLQQFIAHPELVPILLPGSTPSNTVLLCRPGGTKQNFDDALKGIGSLDNGQITSMGFNCSIAHLWIFPAIPQYLPQVTALYFAVSSAMMMYHNVYHGMQKIIPQLKQLKKIEIVGLESSIEEIISIEKLDDEWERLKSWSGLSDTLNRVVMPSKTLWAKVEDANSTDIWVPLSNKPEHVEWLSLRPGYSDMAVKLLETDTKAEFHEVIMGPLLHMESMAGRKFGYVHVPRLFAS